MKHMLLVAAAAFLFVSCDEDFLTIDKSFDGATFTIDVPQADEPGAVSLRHDDVELNIQQRLDEYGVSEDNLRMIVVEAVEVTINDPANVFTFENLSNVALQVDNAALGAVTIADLASATGTTASLDVRDADIKAYLLSDQFSSILTGVSNSAIAAGVTVDVDVTYSLTGGL